MIKAHEEWQRREYERLKRKRSRATQVPTVKTKPRAAATTANAAERMEDVFRFIVAYKQRNDGNSPSLRQILAGTDITTTSLVTFYLQKLQEAGRIRLTEGKFRAIEVVGGRWDYYEMEGD